MAIFLLVGIILAFGGSAVLTAAAGEKLPLVFYTEALEFSFLGTMMFYAAAIMAVAFIIALFISVSKKKDVGEAVLNEVKGMVKKTGQDLKSVSENVSEVLVKVSDSELSRILTDMKEQNETLPLLKRIHQEAEEEKARLANELRTQKDVILQLENENDQLEKKNKALQLIIDNAITPYCIDRDGEDDNDN